MPFDACDACKDKLPNSGMPEKEWLKEEMWRLYSYGPGELRSTAEKTIQGILDKLGYK